MGHVEQRIAVMMAERTVRLDHLSERVGIAKSNLSRIKCDRTLGMHFTTLDALCRELDCTVNDLLRYVPGDDEPTA